MPRMTHNLFLFPNPSSSAEHQPAPFSTPKKSRHIVFSMDFQRPLGALVPGDSWIWSIIASNCASATKLLDKQTTTHRKRLCLKPTYPLDRKVAWLFPLYIFCHQHVPHHHDQSRTNGASTLSDIKLSCPGRPPPLLLHTL